MRKKLIPTEHCTNRTQAENQYFETQVVEPLGIFFFFFTLTETAVSQEEAPGGDVSIGS